MNENVNKGNIVQGLSAGIAVKSTGRSRIWRNSNYGNIHSDSAGIATDGSSVIMNNNYNKAELFDFVREISKWPIVSFNKLHVENDDGVILKYNMDGNDANFLNNTAVLIKKSSGGPVSPEVHSDLNSAQEKILNIYVEKTNDYQNLSANANLQDMSKEKINKIKKAETPSDTDYKKLHELFENADTFLMTKVSRKDLARLDNKLDSKVLVIIQNRNAENGHLGKTMTVV